MNSYGKGISGRENSRKTGSQKKDRAWYKWELQTVHKHDFMKIKSKAEDNRRYDQRVRRFQEPIARNISELGISQIAERFLRERHI